jgi:hypothetical protein
MLKERLEHLTNGPVRFNKEGGLRHTGHKERISRVIDERRQLLYSPLRFRRICLSVVSKYRGKGISRQSNFLSNFKYRTIRLPAHNDAAPGIKGRHPLSL